MNAGAVQSGNGPPSGVVFSDAAGVRADVDERDEHHDGGRAEEPLLGDLGAVGPTGQQSWL